jgi:hypothetical protein
MSQQNLGNPLLAPTYQKTEPFLWIHLALLAAVPLVIVLSMMGLAVGDPVFPGWLEALVLGIPPIALTVWLQWQNPLYPFSLWVLAKPATELSDNQRRVLSVLRRRINGWYIGAWVAVFAGLFMYVVFRQIYITAPLAADLAPFPPVLRLLGILWAEVFFLMANLLWQMGVSAARVMLVPPSEFNSLAPYEVDRISKEFTILGKRSPDLLSLEPLAPIQQTAELVTETDVSESASANPLLAQLSGLLDKVSAFLPGSKSAPVAKSAPVGSPESSGVEASEKVGEVEPVEENKDIAEVEETEEIAKAEQIEEPETVEEITQTEQTESTAEAKPVVTVDTLTADLSSDASSQSTLETDTSTASAPENHENIDEGETTDVASDTAAAEANNQSDRSDHDSDPKSDDEEWV